MGRYVFKFGQVSRYKEWEIPHVSSIKVSVKKQATAFGVPTRSSDDSQIFDMGGPVRTFSISFQRMDWEEEICNWDFMYSKSIKDHSGNEYIGIDEFTGQLQTMRPYRLQIYWQGDAPSDIDPGQITTGRWNVSLTRISMELSPTTPGQADFSLDFTERRAV